MRITVILHHSACQQMSRVNDIDVHHSCCHQKSHVNHNGVHDYLLSSDATWQSYWCAPPELVICLPHDITMVCTTSACHQMSHDITMMA